jgi:transposase-like protein
MSEQNETNETNEDQDIKRWTAKRRAALVIEILRGQTTVAEAARTHGLKASDIELWKDTFLTHGENALRSNPRDELEVKDKKIDQLHRKVGELTMEIEVLQFARKMLGLPPFVPGNSSDK